jgi:hypothetical protein
MNNRIRTLVYIVPMLALTSFLSSALAQDVSIPDPGLNAAIRDALQITNGPLTVQELLGLTNLDASSRDISSVAGLEAASNLTSLFLEKNQLTNFLLLSNLIHLVQLDLSENHLTNLDLSAGLNRLSTLRLSGNEFTSFTLPPGLTNLNQLSLTDNQLTNLTLPGDLGHLTELDLAANPLTSLVLSEALAATTNLTATLDSLRSQGVVVSTYPLTIQLISPRLTPTGAFTFALIGPPGLYVVEGSPDLGSWTELGVLTNQLGTARFTDPAPLSARRFYRARFGL